MNLAVAALVAQGHSVLPLSVKERVSIKHVGVGLIDVTNKNTVFAIHVENNKQIWPRIGTNGKYKDFHMQNM